jgi:hypothetical protein
VLVAPGFEEPNNVIQLCEFAHGPGCAERGIPEFTSRPISDADMGVRLIHVRVCG